MSACCCTAASPGARAARAAAAAPPVNECVSVQLYAYYALFNWLTRRMLYQLWTVLNANNQITE